MTDDSAPARSALPRVDTAVPHSARVWNYWLGGKDNFAADREVGEQIRRRSSRTSRMIARAQRDFLGRAVRYLAGEAGIRQFLDIGTGLPTADNTHEVAQHVAPDCPDRLRRQRPAGARPRPGPAHQRPAGRHRLHRRRRPRPGRRSSRGRRADAGLQPADRADAAGDPRAHRRSTTKPTAIVNRLVDALPPGSYLVIADGTDVDQAGNEAQRRYNEAAPVPYHLRSPEQIAAFFGGLDVLAPGVVPVSQWRPDPSAAEEPADTAVFGGVAHKP